MSSPTFDWGVGYWIDPDGNAHLVDSKYTHNEWATDYIQTNFKNTKITNELEPSEILLKKGWITERNSDKDHQFLVYRIDSKTRDLIFMRSKEQNYKRIYVGQLHKHKWIVNDDPPEALYESILKEQANSLRDELDQFQLSLFEKFPQIQDVGLYIASNDSLHLHTIKIKPEFRGQGIGSQIMREINKFADRHGLVVTLHPEPEPRHKADLFKFYKSNDYVQNKGRHKDYRYSSPFAPTMYRKPKSLKEMILIEAVLSKDFVEKLRNDFLMIVSNIKKLKNYDDAMVVKKACIKWRGMLEEYLTQIRENLQTKQRGGVIGSSQTPNPEWAKHYLGNMKILWKFASEIGHFPVASAEFEKKYGRFSIGSQITTDEIKQTLFNIDNIKEWDARVRRFARLAWKLLNEISEWASRNDLWGGAGDIEIQEQNEFLIDVDGINIKVVGFNEKDLYERKSYQNLINNMKHYISSAKKNFPSLLKKQLPIVFNFTGGRGGEAAKYISSVDGSIIEMNPWATGSPSRMTQVIAHEMGHHIYLLLSKEASKEWDQLIRDDYVKLDLRDVVEQWDEFKKTRSDEYGGEFDNHLKQTDPILYLQLQTLLHHPEYKHYNLLLVGNIKEYLDAGHDPIVYVPEHPTTGYGGKNSEEAFCEVIGNLTAYGPRTILPQVLKWLRMVL